MADLSANETDITEQPTIRAISGDDISDSIRDGIADFAAYPALGLFFGAVYALGGMLITLLALRYELVWVVFPAIAGFILIGPFIAVGLYEISRRRAKGESFATSDILVSVYRQSGREIVILGAALLFALAVWLRIAGLIYALVFGAEIVTVDVLISEMVTTPQGLLFAVLGNAAGALIALFVFSISVVSFPMLVDRDVDFVTAIVTSLRVVIESPFPMIGWGILVVFVLAVAIMPFFIGLVVALPILGHSTWHLYRRAVH
jgi:uncharacterized membrane protein